jgi:hypothetical protein
MKMIRLPNNRVLNDRFQSTSCPETKKKYTKKIAKKNFRPLLRERGGGGDMGFHHKMLVSCSFLGQVKSHTCVHLKSQKD